MDLTVYPDSMIARLPKALRYPALIARNLAPGLTRKAEGRHKYKWASDGMATDHYCPFLRDSAFDALYNEMIVPWLGRNEDVRWRIWILTRCALQCSRLEGSFAEFGVYRGGYAFMILSLVKPAEERNFYLFDTFSGIPATNLTEHEVSTGFAGRLSDTSADYVRGFLGRWASTVRVVEGDVFETTLRTETGKLAFAHVDLNASAPTKVALEYVYPKMLPGGVVLMDDYGWDGYDDQRDVIETFFSQRPETLVALPTGQALMVKL